MANLRIKLKYKSFEIEIDGEETIVQAEFKDIKQNGLGNIVNGVDLNESEYIIETVPRQIEQTSKIISEINQVTIPPNLPTLKDVIMRELPSTDVEWILVFAFFVTDFGNNSFTHKNIIESFENSKIKRASFSSNLSKNIKILFGKGFFRSLNAENDKNYSLTQEGKNETIAILTRTKPSSTIQKSSTKKSTKEKKSEEFLNSGKKTSKSNKFEVLKDVNLRPVGKISLIDFVKTYKIISNADKIVVIIYYLNEVLNINTVTANHIYSGFWELKWKIPTSFYQVINNTKSREMYLDYTNLSDIKLSIQGQNYVRLDLINN